ncbi:MAG: hypothetical protein K0S00_1951 [Xanthobacteraceae bacterium]|jgi:hypothetical protein|nr:hypothetical protein [Xanthobacteraceae bacterium]
MTVRNPRSIDQAAIDTSLADAAYSPEDVAMLERVLNDVCSRAETHVVLNEGVRTLLASAILEGALLGLRDRERLAAFALRVLPAFRNEGADS